VRVTTRKTLTRILVILGLAAVLGVGRNVLFPGGLTWQTAPREMGAADTLALEITLEQAYRLYRQDIPFIDARIEERFTAGHIPEAINIPAAGNFQQKMMAATELDTAQTYVLYCNDEHCPLAHELYEFLRVSGFESLHIMFEGFDGWEQAGYPVSGEEVTRGG